MSLYPIPDTRYLINLIPDTNYKYRSRMIFVMQLMSGDDMAEALPDTGWLISGPMTGKVASSKSWSRLILACRTVRNSFTRSFMLRSLAPDAVT